MLPQSHSRSHYVRRITWGLLLACSAGLLASSAYRAANYPFTCDESLSFAGFNWDPVWGESANNHLLNTWLMQWCSDVLGNSELSLRLPNLMAHGLYLASALALLRRFAHPVLLAAGFVMLNLNPFLLDFFSLARGYGLALAFTLLSLYLLVRAYEEKRGGRGFLTWLCSSALAGALAVLANYAFLNYYLPLLLACAWLLLTDASLRRFGRSHLAAAAALFTACGVFLAFVLSDLFRLQQMGGLYAGGKDGFVTDTVGSLARGSLYSVGYTHVTAHAVSVVAVGLFVILLVLGILLFLKREEGSLLGVLLLMLVSAIALPILQHWLLDTLFPIDRAVLYYVPLFAAVFLSAFHLLERPASRPWSKMAVLLLPAVLAAALGWHFYRSFNMHICYFWWFDAHNDEVLEIIDADRASNFPGRVVRLRNSWMMEPSLSFYRNTRNYTWLEPVSRRAINVTESDYIYAFESEVKGLMAAGHTRLASYPDSQTVLLRINRPRAP